ncbi:hypothetical protein [Microlunatus parietis]|uniref:Uncharacterized protein n=1 Tax=Microlunatus parietis TaxID=682979 RepID=A0A7Y9IE70_9ACTN|nr:hypothetical protein [Microlunatus parietis]NYE75130.1 hypothetical protein [Microlunatus parietis]
MPTTVEFRSITVGNGQAIRNLTISGDGACTLTVQKGGEDWLEDLELGGEPERTDYALSPVRGGLWAGRTDGQLSVKTPPGLVCR